MSPEEFNKICKEYDKAPSYYGWDENHPIFLLAQENDRLKGMINSPIMEEFLTGVHLEAIHQVERWGTATDKAKTDPDWFWLVGYLAGKALQAGKRWPDANGFIPWYGDERPLPIGTMVHVKFRNGSNHTDPSELFRWDHLEDDCDIVAYKVLDSLPEKQDVDKANQELFDEAKELHEKAQSAQKEWAKQFNILVHPNCRCAAPVEINESYRNINHDPEPTHVISVAALTDHPDSMGLLLGRWK